ncbi:MAG: C39 family peptidase [Candidatus Nealsonbacteria bacterium]|nr:C39 family peptidase [Candidatus Nealsonbacteria bacterium]
MNLSSNFLLKISIFAAVSLLLVISLIAADEKFGVFSSAQVVSLNPENASKNIPLNYKVVIKFDKPINRRELQHNIAPNVPGEWKFEDPVIKNHLFKTLVFIPAIDFNQDTIYQINLKNIKSFGMGEPNSSYFIFRTEEGPKNQVLSVATSETNLVDAPLYWQESHLSCEAASLRMALAAKDIYVSEDDIMSKIGYDPTPRKNGVWGDPNKAFVGDINGKICDTGYGVYWDPVAKAAQNWRNAEAFSGWSLKDLIKEIQSGNPVIMWGTLPVETLHDCSWFTPEGKYIKGWREDHVRLIVGFLGDASSPSKIILNDPLAGKLYWSVDYFLTNWEAFGYSGVVIK